MDHLPQEEQAALARRRARLEKKNLHPDVSP
jgi:hypothetical protein